MLAATSTTHSHDHSANGPVICLNCNHEYVGRYCGQCGQRADTHRINWHYIWHEIPHSVWHYDSGIFFTLRELITRPGYTIRDFLAGKRVKHYRPLALLLILGAILVFASRGLDVSFVKHSQQMMETPATDKASGIAKTFQQDMNHFMENNQTLITICMIPLYAFWFWLLFRRRGYNYPELMVTQTFIANFNFVASLFIVLMVWALGGSVVVYSWATGLAAVIIIGYNAWVHTQLFEGKLRRRSIIIRSITAYTASYVSLILVVAIGVVAYGINIGMADANEAKLKKTQPSTIQQPHP